ncbi:MAG TPA: hypothetical protein VK530_05610 [Candidatus Acidoferrum sp.]|nr:hypothetical protein [Candidatus Acidoferrum sp.]
MGRWPKGQRILAAGKEIMTCIIQEPEQRLFLTNENAWTSDFNQAREFNSIRETLQHKQQLHLDDSTVLVFRDKRVYRLEHDHITALESKDD